ncbi:MAG: carbohydrate ABC transporter permease [Clostridia bacterium]|nr:carbohydrate ABC transporter permease [Clostridia bacterium]
MRIRLSKEKSGSGVIRSGGGSAVVFIILLVSALFMLLPFYYAIVQSLKPMQEIFAFPPKFYVRNPTLSNYKSLMQLTNSMWIPFWRYVFNSVSQTAIGTVLIIIISSLAAFPLAKCDFPGRNLIFKTVVTSLLFVGPITAVPAFIVIAKLGLYNTYLALIVPSLASSLGLFLMKNFMEQLNDSLIESAKIDGAGLVTIYYRIVMPLTKPAWITVMILTIQSLWGGAGNGYIYDEQLKSLPVALSQITASGMARSGASAAAGVVLMIPPFIFFVLSQRNVVQTMANAGIKE